MAEGQDCRHGSCADESMSDASSEQGNLGAPLGGADEDWEEWCSEGAGDDDGEPSRSLFQPDLILPSPEAAFTHDRKNHGFDVREYAVQAGLDEYDVLRVINYIRSRVKSGQDPKPDLEAQLQASASSPAPWTGDHFLVPVLEEDGLLCYDYDEYLAEAAANGRTGSNAAAGTSQPEAGTANRQLVEEARALREENEALREMLQGLQLALMPEELRSESMAGAALAAESGSNQAGPSTEPSSQPPTQPAQQPQEPSPVSSKEAAKKEIDDSYFDSYSGFKIHQEMLSDKPRTEAYRDALSNNPSVVRGKRVLDVGCGTGILSMFAARAGADKVVAVDGSDRIAGFARKIAALNGYAAEVGGPMHVVASKLEELKELPGGVDKVDVIVSEWMGYALLFETMLDSVLAARDKWLAPGGVVLPDLAIIYVAGGTVAAQGLDFWEDVYGFKMAPIAQELKEAGKSHAAVLPVSPQHLATSTVTIKTLDLCTMTAEDQDFTAEFRLTPLDSDGAAQQEVASVVLWFDTDFSAARCPEHPVKLSTAPHSPLTHWAQTVLPLSQPVTLSATGGAKAAKEITGRLSMARNKGKHRSLDIGLQYRAVLGDGSVVEAAGVYAMSVLG